MATAVTPVSQQQPWQLSGLDESSTPFFTSTAALSVPGYYNHTDASGGWGDVLPPSVDPRQRVVIDLSIEANLLLLKFYGTPASAASDATSGNRYVGFGGLWGVLDHHRPPPSSPTEEEYLADYLGRFDLVVGADDVSSSNILPTSPDPAVWVRDIAVLEDRSIFPAFRIVGQEADAAAVLVLDSTGYSQVIVELRAVLPTGYSAPGFTVSRANGLGFTYRVL